MVSELFFEKSSAACTLSSFSQDSLLFLFFTFCAFTLLYIFLILSNDCLIVLFLQFVFFARKWLTRIVTGAKALILIRTRIPYKARILFIVSYTCIPVKILLHPLCHPFLIPQITTLGVARFSRL